MRLIGGNAYGLNDDVKQIHAVLPARDTETRCGFGLPKEHDERGFYIVKGVLK
jgi:hypothetical protein